MTANNGTRKNKTCNTCGQSKLLIELVTADGLKVVSLGIKEKIVDMCQSGFDKRRIAGMQLAIDFLQCFVTQRGIILLCFALADILAERCNENLLFTEHGKNIFIRAVAIGTDAECADQRGDRHLFVLINLDIEHVVCIGFIFEPCTAVRNHGIGIAVLTELVNSARIINAR